MFSEANLKQQKNENNLNATNEGNNYLQYIPALLVNIMQDSKEGNYLYLT